MPVDPKLKGLHDSSDSDEDIIDDCDVEDVDNEIE